MVENIYETKNWILGRVKKDIQENGIDRIDVAEMGKLIDMVKDLAEAEKACWESDYYRSVTEAMDGSSGYNMPGYNGRGNMGRSGWSNQYGSGPSRRGYSGNQMNGYGASGYQDHVEALKMEMQNADPQERDRIMQELRGMGIM